MRILNKYFIIIYRIFFLMICGYGLYLNSGLSDGVFQPQMFLYYTILSNLVCFIFIGGCLVKNLREFHTWSPMGIHTILPRVKGSITMCITVTFIIYHFILAPTAFIMSPDYSLYSMRDIIVHYVVPFMMIFDWILLDKKGLYRITEPLLWIGLPYVYLIFALVRGYFGGSITPGGSKYPYFFLDIEKVGSAGVIKYTLGLTAFFIILGYLILGIDKVLDKTDIKKNVQNGL